MSSFPRDVKLDQAAAIAAKFLSQRVHLLCINPAENGISHQLGFCDGVQSASAKVLRYTSTSDRARISGNVSRFIATILVVIVPASSSYFLMYIRFLPGTRVSQSESTLCFLIFLSQLA